MEVNAVIEMNFGDKREGRRYVQRIKFTGSPLGVAYLRTWLYPLGLK